MADSERSLDRRVDWTPGPDIDVSPTRSIVRANWTIERYAKLGIRQPVGNRLEQSRRFLAQFAGRKAKFDSTDEKLLRRIADCTQTCFEHYLIARSTDTDSGELTPEMVRKTEESLTGAELADEEENSPGRDTQFELFVHALVVAADVRVWIEEPDFRFLYNGQEVGLAAKRVKRRRRLRRRFNRAVKQIERSGISGFVAVNADLLVRDFGTEANAPDLETRFKKGLKPMKPIDEFYSSYPFVMGRMVFGTVFMWHLGKEPPWLQFGSFRDYRVYPHKTEEEARAGDRFFLPMLERISQRMAQLD